MKARLIKTKTNEQLILCNDGTICEAKNRELNFMLTRFIKIEELTGEQGRWDTSYPDMFLYPGQTLAYITDSYELVISDITPFNRLFNVSIEVDLESILSVAEYGKLHNKSIEQVKLFCRMGRIPGAIKKSGIWFIPADAPYPQDERYTRSGYFRNPK